MYINLRNFVGIVKSFQLNTCKIFIKLVNLLFLPEKNIQTNNNEAKKKKRRNTKLPNKFTCFHKLHYY